MNRRNQIRLTEREQADLLRDAKKVALATIGKDGYPHLVMMNFVARDGAILMSSYGKAQKVVNIRRNPKVAVMAERGRHYGELRGIMIRGECEIVSDPAIVVETMRAIRGREAAGAEAVDIPATVSTKRVILKVIPAKIATWDHGKLGGKY
jgi:nitroimidazol reductase NimA-like FMN-containing flavoprotein (pyridoxamine 5'-phosphate oxidase superfamily)